MEKENKSLSEKSHKTITYKFDKIKKEWEEKEGKAYGDELVKQAVKEACEELIRGWTILNPFHIKRIFKDKFGFELD